MITPSRLLPELDINDVEPWFEERGRSRYLLGGLRILRHDSGRIERADQRFPRGSVKALPLPDRLGGGYVFYQADSQGTRLWRAKDWTAELKPLAHINPTATEVLPGFDRLYLRTKTNKLFALDAEAGRIMPLGQLPAASGYGAMAFADGWRAVVDTDLVGPVASFDAGASWHPLGIEDEVISAQVEDGDPILYVKRGVYRLDLGGHLQFVSDEERDHAEGADDDDDDGGGEQAEHPLGDRPLRVAIEHGYPDTARTVVVAHRGALVRVRVFDGEVLARAPRALPNREAECTGVRVGTGFGFVCGAARDDTVVYRYRQPMHLDEVARFAGPRFVAASGNGALVVRGSCREAASNAGEGQLAQSPSGSDTRGYCIVGVDGRRREIAVRGELGAERVVALRDGRVVVLVPPRLGQPGKINIIDGSKLSEHELSYPKDAATAASVARRGLWLEGFEQRGDAIRGWVEAGGPVVGVSVALDGKVQLGKVYDEGGQVLMAGRFALALGDTERARESLDGGKTWRELELPELPEHPGDAKTRACTAVGCALRGWLRLGWGKPAVKDDLQTVATPDPVGVKPRAGAAMALSCRAVGEPDERGAPPSSNWNRGNWGAFLGTPPPKLGRDEVGVDVASQPYSQVPSHVYVWGPKGADWTRTGWWQIRWEDRFAEGDGTRMSGISRPPWADEVSAAEAIGSRRGSAYWRWEAMLEPSGDAALLSHCTSSGCNPHAVSQGRPIVRLRSPQGGTAVFRKALEHGVARIGEAWYLLSDESGAAPLALWRASLGVMRPVATFRRLNPKDYATTGTPRLVRRRLGNELGLLIEVPPDPSTGERNGTWMVLPIDTADGTLGEPVSLGRVDLDGRVPPRCGEHNDGWLLETQLPTNPNIRLLNASGYLDDIEMRLRLEPGGGCVEAMAAKAGRGFRTVESNKESAPIGDDAIVMVAAERYAGRRWQLRCVAAP